MNQCFFCLPQTQYLAGQVSWRAVAQTGPREHELSAGHRRKSVLTEHETPPRFSQNPIMGWFPIPELKSLQRKVLIFMIQHTIDEYYIQIRAHTVDICL